MPSLKTAGFAFGNVYEIWDYEYQTVLLDELTHEGQTLANAGSIFSEYYSLIQPYLISPFVAFWWHCVAVASNAARSTHNSHWLVSNRHCRCVWWRCLWHFTPDHTLCALFTTRQRSRQSANISGQILFLFILNSFCASLFTRLHWRSQSVSPRNVKANNIVCAIPPIFTSLFTLNNSLLGYIGCVCISVLFGHETLSRIPKCDVARTRQCRQTASEHSKTGRIGRWIIIHDNYHGMHFAYSYMRSATWAILRHPKMGCPPRDLSVYKLFECFECFEYFRRGAGLGHNFKMENTLPQQNRPCFKQGPLTG